jgi:uncharacterized DUF497 family protein
MADFEWDPKKEVLNVRNHGIDFSTASLIWDGVVVKRAVVSTARSDFRLLEWQKAAF